MSLRTTGVRNAPGPGPAAALVLSSHYLAQQYRLMLCLYRNTSL